MKIGMIEEAWQALEGVLDPELDTPITELGFVSALEIEGRHAKVHLRLPTFWCAANFAYLMAWDTRQVLMALPSIQSVEVVLKDHFADKEITHGVNQGLRFPEVFPEEAADELEALRRQFVEKAYLQRHELLLRLLMRQLTTEQVINLRIGQLEEDSSGLWVHQALERRWISQTNSLLRNYLSRRRALGLATDPNAFLALTPEGRRINGEALPEYLSRCRTTRLNIAFNRALCERLLEARYSDREVVT